VTTRVRFSSPWQGHHVNDVVDLDDDDARRIITAGYAQSVDAATPVVSGPRAVFADYGALDDGQVLAWNATRAIAEGVDPAAGGGTGGTGGITTETDPVATAALTTHKNATDPHGDRAAAATDAASKVTAHRTAADPHGDRAAATADATSKVAAHTAAPDPHGDRAYTDARVTAVTGAPPAALDTLQEISAQLQSDETGAAAMLASINANRAEIDGHVAAATGAHAASAVSFDDTGLIVVKGGTVKAALAAIDTWTQNRTLAALKDVDVAGLTDGEHLAWQAATGKFVPAAPSGASEAGYAENGSGTVTGPVVSQNGNFAAAGALAVALTDIIVLPTARPVYLDAYALLQQTTLGVGFAVLEIWETTGAAAFLSRSPGMPLPNSTNGTIAGRVGGIHPPVRIGPVAAQRSFQLRINCWGVGAAPAVQAMNASTLGFKSWLRALAT
jgi:hypothetical protein